MSTDSSIPYTAKTVATATGIDAIKTNTDDDAWYTLEGKMQKGQPTKKGIYIHKGKKVSVE